jgi:transposase
LYNARVQALGEVEELCRQGLVDLYYGDESHVCSQGYVPYGWQFPGEEVRVPSQKGFRLNIFGLISRSSECFWATTQASIDSEFVIRQLEDLSFRLRKDTFVVLDNASVHTSRKFRERLAHWRKRGLFIFYLPPYSPHLNIAETLWRVLKTDWLRPQDYSEDDQIAYAANRCLANVGTNLVIKFSPFRLS